MPSLFPGYEYDIFISYRHNDNRSGWVTEFVKNLQEELSATIKEPVSVYFDINPHDGLLETHNVDKSLEGKLKCLIFIPILSQTYCDPKSFAWEHEFMVFNRMADEDQFGKHVQLHNGNVCSRILPVKIHDLDADDKKIVENELDSVLRCVEFIFRAPGVNRPLNSLDNPEKNLNHSSYRDQINKVANSVKETIGILKQPSGSTPLREINISHTSFSKPKLKAVLDSIAVLPFANMTSDPEQEYFSDGISEEIINTLAQIPNLKVAGRTSSFTFKGKNEDLRIVGEKLNVRTILEGSVRTSGNRIRITAQLIDVENGYHLYSEKFDRVLDDIFLIQDEIANAIVEKLQITLSGKLVTPQIREQTQNVEAYQYYLKGRALAYKRGNYLFEAIEAFQMALSTDPEYSLAYAGLADTYTVICYYGAIDLKEAWPRAIYNARQAMKFGPDLAETYCCNAAISMLHDWEWEKSERFYLKALALKPGYEQARTWYGLHYLQGAFLKHDEGVSNCRIALDANPLSYYSHSMLGCSLHLAGKNDEALEKAKRGIEIDPNSYFAHYFLGCNYYGANKFEEAEKTFQIALSLSNRHSWALTVLGVLYVDWNKKEKAQELYTEIISESKKKYIQPAVIAMLSAALGYNDEALRFAHQACDERDPFIIFTAKCWISGKALRAVPGFNEVLKRVKLT
jgi:TolB-like protein/Tfp pilus assembly protein PilF